MSDQDHDRQRMLIAQEAARLMLDEGVRDFHLAKHKAAQRFSKLGAALPRNSEIEHALREHQRLFNPQKYQAHLLKLRKAALYAMRLLENFRPCLVGAVLNGTAGKQAQIDLHLFADTAEEILVTLLELGLVYRALERRLRTGPSVEIFPAVRFILEGCEIEAVIFPFDKRHHAPLSAVDGKPIRRADLAQVERLIDSEPD